MILVYIKVEFISILSDKFDDLTRLVQGRKTDRRGSLRWKCLETPIKSIGLEVCARSCLGRKLIEERLILGGIGK